MDEANDLAKATLELEQARNNMKQAEMLIQRTGLAYNEALKAYAEKQKEE